MLLSPSISLTHTGLSVPVWSTVAMCLLQLPSGSLGVFWGERSGYQGLHRLTVLYLSYSCYGICLVALPVAINVCNVSHREWSHGWSHYLNDRNTTKDTYPQSIHLHICVSTTVKLSVLSCSLCASVIQGMNGEITIDAVYGFSYLLAMGYVLHNTVM